VGRTADPVQDLLSRVTCTGATGAGKNGRTIVRAAPDVMRNERGMAIAQRLRELWIQGCDVRIAYTVMGVDVFRFLGAGTARVRCRRSTSSRTSTATASSTTTST
jgi:hypothetical protein